MLPSPDPNVGDGAAAIKRRRRAVQLPKASHGEGSMLLRVGGVRRLFRVDDLGTAGDGTAGKVDEGTFSGKTD